MKMFASSITNRVYPRVCGGTHTEMREMADFLGLSPRVRGNPVAVECVASSTGSIPACAGEPPIPGE